MSFSRASVGPKSPYRSRTNATARRWRSSEFHLVHFYALGLAAAIVRHKTGLLGIYVVWLLLLAAMAWPCAWYYRRRAGRRAAG